MVWGHGLGPCSGAMLRGTCSGTTLRDHAPGAMLRGYALGAILPGVVGSMGGRGLELIGNRMRILRSHAPEVTCLEQRTRLTIARQAGFKRGI
jgi:hypothetical protein